MCVCVCVFFVLCVFVFFSFCVCVCVCGLVVSLVRRQALAEALKQNRTISTFDLEGNNVDTEGAKARTDFGMVVRPADVRAHVPPGLSRGCHAERQHHSLEPPRQRHR